MQEKWQRIVTVEPLAGSSGMFCKCIRGRNRIQAVESHSICVSYSHAGSSRFPSVLHAHADGLAGEHFQRDDRI